jgi:signal transduction histidine kinase
MKLFTKYNRVNILATIATFIVGSVAFYAVLYFVLRHQLDDTLRSEEQEITGYVQSHGQLPDFENTRHQWITAAQTTTPLTRKYFASYIKHDYRDGDDDWIRQLTFSIKVNNINFNITVNRPEAETEYLLRLMIMVTLAMIGLILLVNYFINRRLINRLLMPFYNTIEIIKDYRVAIEKPLQLPREPIDEIALLNESVNEMTARIYREYQALKSFTENASHEMQTPLAVINGKIEVLLQNDTLNEAGIQQLLAIEQATKKLARLHQSLLLLAKLENRQFIADEPVNMQQIVALKIDEWQDLILSHRVFMHLEGEKTVVAFHHQLAEILVNNLLNNALRYTPAGGNIHVLLKNNMLRVSNTAASGHLDAERVFRRFYKTQNGAEGTGLGLAIIKEIGSLAGFDVTYGFDGENHLFTIYFSNKTALA